VEEWEGNSNQGEERQFIGIKEDGRQKRLHFYFQPSEELNEKVALPKDDNVKPLKGYYDPFRNHLIHAQFWRSYEMDFPERPNVMAPRGFRFSLWSLFDPVLSLTINIELYESDLLNVKNCRYGGMLYEGHKSWRLVVIS
jgi:hypothetical protein